MAGAIIGALRAELSASVAQFEKDFEKGAKAVEGFAKKFDKFGQSMQAAGAKLSLAITAPLALFAKTSTDAARDAEELQSKFGFVFKAIGSDMNKWAEDTGDAMGRSTQTMQELASTFGLLFNKAAPTAQAAGDLSKNFSQLALDLSSFFNVSEGDAMEKLRAGLVGEAEPLRAFGVFLNAADVEARALQMGLAKTSKELTEQDKILARANIIMEQTKVAQGDLARTADSAANQQRKLKEEWQEMSVQVGTALLPILTQLTQALVAVVGWFKNLSPELQTIIGTTAAVAAALGPLLLIFGTMATGIGSIIRLVPALVAGIKAIGLAATTSGSAINGMSKGLLALAAAPLVFEGGKTIGGGMGKELGLLQAQMTFGISREEAEKLYKQGVERQAKQLRDAQKAADDKTKIDQAQYAEQIRLAEEAAQKEFAASVAAAQKAADEAFRIKAAAAEKSKKKDDEDMAVPIAVTEGYDPNAYADQLELARQTEAVFAAAAADMGLLSQNLAEMPTYMAAEDWQLMSDGIDASVNALGDFVLNGGDAEDIVKRLLMQLLNMTLLAPALASLAAIMKSIGGGFLSGGFSGAGDAIGAAFAGGFAEGGTIPRGQWGIVGERGPEPVFAGGGALQVLPNNSGGGGGTNQTFNISTPDADSFRRSERQIARDGRRKLKPES